MTKATVCDYNVMFAHGYRRFRLTVLLFIIMVATQTGCTVPRSRIARHDSHPHDGLPARYKNYYDYWAGAVSDGTIINTKKSSNYTVNTVEIPLSLPVDLRPKSLESIKAQVSTMERTDTHKADDLKLLYLSRIDLYKPADISDGEKRPAILISPILGGNMVVDHFAKYYAKHGFIAAIVHRKEIFWNPGEGFQQVENYLRSSTIRIRQALDWLLVQKNVDNKRIGAFGISFGAIMHSILAAADDRVKYHVLAMPAAPLPAVVVKCGDPAVREIIPIVRKEYNISISEVHERLKNTIVTDPILMKSGVNRDNMLIYIAIFDRVVGTRRSFQLWRAFGKPRLKILPFGHYGGILVLPILQYQTLRIFEKELG